ncbi:MAG: HupE/UreJ family protein [Bryobacteraceae bacterium]|nr:HupE/UreJ family protein [Bryobacteraceae bacterium]MDW8379141.1 HupE/UreJ family protein [Bryobacterales bacterium]
MAFFRLWQLNLVTSGAYCAASGRRSGWLILWAVLAAPAGAHVISMSTADLEVSGAKAVYRLRMPLYELQHMPGPEKAIFDHIRILSQGKAGRLVAKDCREDAKEGAFLCKAEYEWDNPVEELEIVCTFYAVTVPNHVHLVRAVKGEKSDQAVFDFSQPKAQIRFRPPTPFETWMTAFGSGIARAFSSAAAVLFLACLALAARNWIELGWITLAFFLGETISAIVVPLMPWNPSPRFVEAALALTIAYLAVEILSLPTAGYRWAVCGVLGLFHGLSYAIYLTATGYEALPVLAGVALSNLAAVAFFSYLRDRIARGFVELAPLGGKVAASLLLLTGLVWFYQRLRG